LLCDGLDGRGSVYGLFEAHAIISSAKANFSLCLERTCVCFTQLNIFDIGGS
jgi:hypothetical protein